MEIRQDLIRIKRNDEWELWELYYKDYNNPIAYSGSWEFLYNNAEVFVSLYKTHLRLITERAPGATRINDEGKEENIIN